MIPAVSSSTYYFAATQRMFRAGLVQKKSSWRGAHSRGLVIAQRWPTQVNPMLSEEYGARIPLKCGASNLHAWSRDHGTSISSFAAICRTVRLHI